MTGLFSSFFSRVGLSPVQLRNVNVLLSFRLSDDLSKEVIELGIYVYLGMRSGLRSRVLISVALRTPFFVLRPLWPGDRVLCCCRPSGVVRVALLPKNRHIRSLLVLSFESWLTLMASVQSETGCLLGANLREDLSIHLLLS